jgi:hypothetical protein
MAETLDFRSPSQVTCSVQILISCSCTSFMNTRLNNSKVSTALHIARPLALITIWFEPPVNAVMQAIT